MKVQSSDGFRLKIKKDISMEMKFFFGTQQKWKVDRIPPPYLQKPNNPITNYFPVNLFFQTYNSIFHHPFPHSFYPYFHQ